MGRRELSVLFGLSVTLGILLTALAFRMLPFFTVLFGSVIPAAALLGVLFLPKRRLRDVRASPEHALAYLARRLRLAQHRVEGKPGELIVRIGSIPAMRIGAQPNATGCALSYKLEATPSGWSVLMIAIIVLGVGLVAIPILLYVFARVRLFTADQILPLLPPDGSLPELPAADEVHTALVEGLAEGHRLAAEAYEAVRSYYWDFLSVLLTSMVVVVGVGGLIIMVTEPDSRGQLILSTLPALAAVAGFGTLSGLLGRRLYRPRLLEYGAWAERLSAAWAKEAAHAVTEGEQPSAFELLAETSKEVHTWVLASRRSWYRDPAAWLVMFALGSSAFWLFFAGALMVQLGSMLYAVALGLAGIAVCLGLYVFSQRVRRQQNEDRTRELASWARRLEAMRSRMEHYLQDL